MIKKTLLFFFLCSLGVVNAQNTPVTQYYSVPTLLNPGLTGSIDKFRANILYRGQIAGGGLGNLSNIFSFDYNVPNNGLGVGLMVDQLVRTDVNQRSTFLNGLVSYTILAGDKWVFSPGIKISYGRIDFNYLSNSYYIPYSPSQSNFADNVTFFNTSAGLMIHEENFWFGTYFFNLNEPSISVFSDEENNLITAYTVHTGYKYLLQKGPTELETTAISIALNYSKNPNIKSEINDQTPTDKLDLGAYYTSGFTQVGLWYRGIAPSRINATDTYIHPHTMALMAGIEVNGLKFSYGFEFQVRGTGVSDYHEITLGYNFGHVNSKDSNFLNRKSPLPII